MTAPETRPPVLGTDDIVRFAGLDHFLAEIAGNLGRGRALVQTSRSFELNTRLIIGIEAPVTGQRIPAAAAVVYAKDGLLGLEIIGFREQVRAQLTALRAAAEAAGTDPPGAPGGHPAPEASEPAPRYGSGKSSPGSGASSGVADIEPSPPPAPTGACDPRHALAEKPATVEGVAVLAATHRALLRAAPDGTLRVRDKADLLGLYLAQLRHGRITVLDGPGGSPGQPVALRLTGAIEVALDARIAARAGPWLTLDIADPAPVHAAIAVDRHAWRGALEGLLGPPAEPPKRTGGPASSGPPPPVQPTAPHLNGDRVLFATTADLVCELEGNLASGGLFVRSDPLPIRERRELELVVGGTPWGVHMQADVVFASDGRVGFSVTNAANVRTRLQEIMARGGPHHPGGTSDLSIDLHPGPSPHTGDLATFRGTLDRPPTNRELLSLSRGMRTNLAGGPLAVSQLVRRIVHRRWRGVLTLESSGATLRIWFHRGDVAFVSSEPYDPSKSVGRILINQKKLTDGALREALKKSTATGRPLGRTLVALGSVRKGDLVAALREQSRLKLEKAFELGEGTYEWTPWRNPPGDADLVLTRGLSIVGRFVRIRLETLNTNAVELLFGPDLGRAVLLEADVDPTDSGLNLQPKELRFLELQLDGTRTIQDATLASPIGRLASLRLIGLCLAVGLLRFADGGAPRPPSQREQSMAAATLEQSLRERIAKMHEQNHFDILGVHWSAHPRNYREAWNRARQEFADDEPLLREAPPTIQDLARTALGTIERSFRALKDREQRIRYRNGLFDRTEREYAADMLVKQGEFALMRGDRAQAVECLETAIELNPSDRNRALLVSAQDGRS